MNGRMLQIAGFVFTMLSHIQKRIMALHMQRTAERLSENRLCTILETLRLLRTTEKQPTVLTIAIV